MKLEMRSYRVCYQVEKTDKAVVCTIKTADLKELHRVLVQMTNYKMPVADWFDLVVHDVSSTSTKEYGQMYIGLMYDTGFNFKSKVGPHIIGADKEESTPLFTKGLTRTTRGISISKPKSIAFAEWMMLGDTSNVH